jgi:UDP-N-acetylmuramoyl-L-alanyl-D-glutamate--2,6-diaminopimelate ligase
MFVAYRGVNQDTHHYIPDALARGAVALLVERSAGQVRRDMAVPPDVPIVSVPNARLARALVAAALYDHPSSQMMVVGVTGTDGKTTTCTLTHAILQAGGVPAGLVSTVAARIGPSELDTGLHTTTPEPEDVQSYLRLMADAGLKAAVLEVTSHGLAQHRVAAVHFDVAVITNITHEALEYHGTFEEYRAAKAMLFRSLASRPAKSERARAAIINADDPSAEYLAAIQADVRLTYGLSRPADVTARNVRHNLDGLSFTLVSPRGEVDMRSALLGQYNVHNILAASCAGLALGLSPLDIQRGVAEVIQVPGRMERIEAGQSFTAIVDFAHTPNALHQALATARQLTPGRVIAVFGCAGLRDTYKRQLMGQASARLADLTIITAEDPRTERLEDIMAAVAAGAEQAGAVEGQTYWRVPDRFDAIAMACSLAHEGDVVIVCGKGHEQSMAFGQAEYAWSDRQAVRCALAGQSYAVLPTASAPAMARSC